MTRSSVHDRCDCNWATTLLAVPGATCGRGHDNWFLPRERHRAPRAASGSTGIGVSDQSSGIRDSPVAMLVCCDLAAPGHCVSFANAFDWNTAPVARLNESRIGGSTARKDIAVAVVPMPVGSLNAPPWSSLFTHSPGSAQRARRPTAATSPPTNSNRPTSDVVRFDFQVSTFDRRSTFERRR